MKMNTKKLVIIGLLAVLSIAVMTVAAVPPLIPSSEQRIASMELNQSAGNMTGDDYMVALMFEFINCTVETQDNTDLNGGSLSSKYNELVHEADRKFPEYGIMRNFLENVHSFLNPLWKLMEGSSDHDSVMSSGGGVTTYSYPLQGYIDLCIDRMFKRTAEYYGGLNEYGYIDEARAASQLRLAEEARQKALLLEREEQQKTAQQEKEAQQHALDAHYKNLSENYTVNLTSLLNQSKLDDALNLSNESIGNLVSPYSNIVMISRGDIYASMGRYEAAIESYKSAQTDFIYSNESADYKDGVYKSFVENKWDRVAEMKIGIAQQNIDAQINAKIHDLRDAPNVKQLLTGHDHDRQYTVNVENYTYAGSGYAVFINISAYNDPKAPNVTEYIGTSIPMCIDMFAGVFGDKKVTEVRIQTNASYFDKFGHIQERPVMIASLDNATATQIGDWNAFKQYVGADRDKFEQVINLDLAY